MEYAYIKITTDGNIQLVEKDTHYFKLQELKDAVGCKTIQIVRSILPNFDVLMVIDDNGKIVKKPVNLHGTFLYGQPNDYIAGDLVIGTSHTENPNDEPDIFALPIKIAQELYEMLNEL